MKLVTDFGVKALLATIAALGYYGALFLVLLTVELDTVTVVALLGAAAAPWFNIAGVYFGFRIAEKIMKNGGTQ